jgi:hypothetical protein
LSAFGHLPAVHADPILTFPYEGKELAFPLLVPLIIVSIECGMATTALIGEGKGEVRVINPLYFLIHNRKLRALMLIQNSLLRF